MGPRFCKLGNVNIESSAQCMCKASMGPRFCKRGNDVDGFVRYLGDSVLQWGHAFVSVETSAPSGRS